MRVGRSGSSYTCSQSALVIRPEGDLLRSGPGSVVPDDRFPDRSVSINDELREPLWRTSERFGPIHDVSTRQRLGSVGVTVLLRSRFQFPKFVVDFMNC